MTVKNICTSVGIIENSLIGNVRGIISTLISKYILVILLCSEILVPTSIKFRLFTSILN